MPACGATRRGPVAIKSLREPSLLNGRAVHAESLVAIDVPMVLERAFPRNAGFRPLVKPRVRALKHHERIKRKEGSNVLPSHFAVHADAEESRRLARQG